MKKLLSKGTKGFTLIELMIVIAIIAILAAVLIPNFVKARAQSQLAACESNLKNIGTALELYNSQNTNYPTALAQLTTAYIQSVPVCPADKTAYTYATTASAPYSDYTNRQSGAVHLNAGLVGATSYPLFRGSQGLII